MKTFFKRILIILAHEFGRRPTLKRLTLRALSISPRLNTLLLSRLARLRAKHVRPITLDQWGVQIYQRLQFQSKAAATSTTTHKAGK